MKYKEQTFIDKGEWGEGEWVNEPDKIQWADEATGLPCLIVRNLNVTGALCGYVGVDKDHPYFESNYSNVDVEAHGGLTYSNKCQPNPDGVCHKVEKGEDDNIWWFGFDCAHALDLAPAMEFRSREFNAQWKKTHPNWDNPSTYKNIEYVKQEVTSLAKQLHEAKI